MPLSKPPLFLTQTPPKIFQLIFWFLYLPIQSIPYILVRRILQKCKIDYARSYNTFPNFLPWAYMIWPLAISLILPFITFPQWPFWRPKTFRIYSHLVPSALCFSQFAMRLIPFQCLGFSTHVMSSKKSFLFNRFIPLTHILSLL